MEPNKHSKHRNWYMLLQITFVQGGCLVLLVLPVYWVGSAEFAKATLTGGLLQTSATLIFAYGAFGPLQHRGVGSVLSTLYIGVTAKIFFVLAAFGWLFKNEAMYQDGSNTLFLFGGFIWVQLLASFPIAQLTKTEDYVEQE